VSVGSDKSAVAVSRLENACDVANVSEPMTDDHTLLHSAMDSSDNEVFTDSFHSSDAIHSDAQGHGS